MFLIILILVLIIVKKQYVVLFDFSESTKIMIIMIIYIVISLPLVKWPGSVIKNGSTFYIKAIIFYFYTIMLVENENKFKTLLFIFIGCQIFRILEP